MDKLIKKINTSPLIRRRVISGDVTQSGHKTFGVPLRTLIEREEFSKVPRVLINICEFLSLNGLETEGIFRVNANTKAVESIKQLFQENYTVDISNYTDVYAVASVLKQFLRELPNGVVQEKLALQFVEAYKQNFNNLEKCLEVFRSLLSSLNEENYNLLKYLCHFLTKVVEKEEFNKMNSVNIGIVFGPNVFKSSQDMEGLKMQTNFNNVMTVLVCHYQSLFVYDSTLRNSNVAPSYLSIDTPIVTHTLSTEVHKSSPSLSGDFDLSSSNDNQILPAPLPSSISSTLHKAIISCVNNHLSMTLSPNDSNHPASKLKVPSDIDLHMSRTSSLPHSIFKYSYDLSSCNNESNEFSLKSEMEPTAPPRYNLLQNGSSKIKKPQPQLKFANRKPLLATQDSWSDIIERKDVPDFNYLTHNLENTVMIDDDIMPDWQGQNNLIDLDDFDGDDYLMNEMKENSLKNPNLVTIEYSNKKVNIIELQERYKFIRNKLREFEESFEFLHGCKPQSIEKTGNSQVQEWLAELVSLREQLSIHESENNFENLSGDIPIHRVSHKTNTYDNNLKINSNLQSGTSTLSGVSEHIGASSKIKGITNFENLNVQNISVSQFLDHLNVALENQRRRASRPESLSEMTREQFEEEKIDLQKCLLHYEKNYGRPKEHDTKQIMKPLYDRYRLVKRYIKSPENECKVFTNLVTSQINGEYGQSNTSLSSRPKGFIKQSEGSPEGGGSTSKKDQLTSTMGYEINQQMSQSFTGCSDDKTNHRKANSSTGSLMSSGSQEQIIKVPTSQNSNTVPKIISSESICQKSNFGGNLKLKYQQSSVPLSAENTVVHNTPLHSVYSTKSFSSSAEEIIPFRTCNTMTKVEIEIEKDILLIEKRRLQKLLKDFEHGLEKITGRKVEKSDRDHMRAEYDRYKTIKCRLRTLDKELES